MHGASVPPHSNPNDTTTASVTILITQAIDTSGGKDAIRGYATISTQNGAPLASLTAGNFTVTETVQGSSREVPLTSLTPRSEGGADVSFVLVLDRSGSMAGTPLADLKTASKAFVDNIQPGDEVELIAFDSSVSTLQGFTANKQALKSAIDGMSTGGSTAMYDALDRAITTLTTGQRNGIKCVILMTDGVSNAGQTQAQVLPRVVAANIPVYTIGLGSGVRETDLRKIADDSHAGKNGTGYFHAPTSAQLASLCAQIANVISQIYVLEWASSANAGQVVDVDIAVRYTAARGTFTDHFSTSFTCPAGTTRRVGLFP